MKDLGNIYMFIVIIYVILLKGVVTLIRFNNWYLTPLEFIGLLLLFPMVLGFTIIINQLNKKGVTNVNE